MSKNMIFMAPVYMNDQHK